jgi:polyisoprenoid-binding protein YceI
MHPTLRAAACLSLAVGVGASGLAFAAAAPAKKPAPAAAPAGKVSTWTVDKANSRIRFKSAFGGAAFEGGFDRWDAQIAFDPKNLAASKVTATIDLASAKTGDADRDQTLPTDEWFNTAKFPRATFTTSAIRDAGGGKYQAVGTLNLKGVSKPVTLPFTLAITGDQARMTGSVVIKRNDFGVGQGQFAGADTVPFEVTVNIAVAAKRAG